MDSGSSSQLPLYRTFEPPFIAEPPFSFPGVSLRVFPLRANRQRLNEFCYRYLNSIVPEEVGYFVPAMSKVFFALINYGRMASAATNSGWVAQNEVVFTVPLEWYKKDPKTGNLVFHDWASITPFIFVDSPASLTAGREVFGWPKVLAELTGGIDPWTRSPTSARPVMTLSAMLFEEVFAGQRQQMRPLIEIDYSAAATEEELPPRWDGPLNPIHYVPHFLRGSLTSMGDTLASVMRLPIRGHSATPTPLLSRMNMARRLFENNILRKAKWFRPNWYNNTINLKQFRDARDPSLISYQALTNSQMHIKRFNRGGLLGGFSILRGDPSGGHRIRVHRYEAQPIIQSLGLEVSQEWTDHGIRVATLKPYWPFWLDLDNEYGHGQTLAWRTKESDWRAGSRAFPGVASTKAKRRFNTTRSAAVQQVSGPFMYANTTARVLPLLADASKLRQVCADYLGTTGDLVFEAWGSYVYMMIVNFDEQASESVNIGRFADKNVTFFIPVKVYRKPKDAQGEVIEGAQAELVSLGVLTPFNHANTSLAAISGREINGFRAMHADIHSPEGGWLGEAGPARRRSELMTCMTDVLPSLDLGQEVERREVLRVITGNPLGAHEEAWGEVAAEWGPRLWADYEAKRGEGEDRGEAFDIVQALALEILAPGGLDETPEDQPQGCTCDDGWWRLPGLNDFTLKQFRDAEAPGHACYQAVVQNRYTINRLYDMQEMDGPIHHVGIHSYPSHDIVKVLGLRVKRTDYCTSPPVHWLEPQRPFWARFSMRAEAPREILFRAGADKKWKAPAPEPCPQHPDAPAPTRPQEYFASDGDTQVGLELVREIDEQETRLAKAMRDIENLSEQFEEDKKRRAEAGTSEEAETRFAAQHQRALDEALAGITDHWANRDALHPRWRPGKIKRKRRDLQQAKQLWLARDPKPELITREKARDAVCAIREPQAVLEHILSKEWGHQGDARWFREVRRLRRQRRSERRRATFSVSRGRQEKNELYELFRMTEHYEKLAEWGVNETVDAMADKYGEGSYVTGTPASVLLATLTDGQKRSWYIRSDSLGPHHGDSFEQEHDLLEEETYWYLPDEIPQSRVEEQLKTPWTFWRYIKRMLTYDERKRRLAEDAELPRAEHSGGPTTA